MFVVSARLFGCITNSLQEGRFAGIGASDDENTKMFIFLSKLESILGVAHVAGRCRCKGMISIDKKSRLSRAVPRSCDRTEVNSSAYKPLSTPVFTLLHAGPDGGSFMS